MSEYGEDGDNEDEDNIRDDDHDDDNDDHDDDNDDHDNGCDVVDGDNVDVDDADLDGIDNVDDVNDVDERMDKDGVIIEYDAVVGSYWELPESCSLDELLTVDDTKVFVEDTAKDIYKVSSEVKLGE